jgi:predicted O-methyltransferase YrrM
MAASLLSGCGGNGGEGARSSVAAARTEPAWPSADRQAEGDGEDTLSVAALLAEIRQADAGQLAVSEEDGRFLRTLVASSGARRALEIGGASGYSAIWIGLGLRETGGRLVSIEYDPARADALARNIRRAGLGDIVQVVRGNAFEQVPALDGTFDFVFLDAWKQDYRRFFDLVYPRLAPGGLFVAHNVVNKREEMGDFLSAITERPDLLTTIVSPSGEGMSVSYRRRATISRR